ncbi:MAG: bifunctional diaminohydroxyphosphoribosylaminopyrimidine deaminase/5-amino-6-(5-phosphoribosylamino)uracil reductase RibD [Halocynthiibacter sp.]
MTDRSRDIQFMKTALGLARRGLGATGSNPTVGCVIVKEGRVVGRGVTQPGGRPHGEVMALAQAGPAAKGATVYVTLEPCSHYGRTPPCAKALISAGVARVVSAVEDTDARVAGRGHAMLRAAGIVVDVGHMAEQAREMNAGFFLRLSKNRPFVTLKLAMSLDGKIATSTGESQWITGPEARRRVHLLRAQHDAVMVGGGTLRADDPSLDVRGLGDMHQPAAIVVTGQGVPEGANLLRMATPDRPLWICGSAGENRDGVTYLSCAKADAGVDVADMLTQLGQEGLTRVFCEGGGALAASLLKANMVDELVVFSAGIMLGQDGRSGLGPMGFDALSEAARFRCVTQEKVGADVMQVWRR